MYVNPNIEARDANDRIVVCRVAGSETVKRFELRGRAMILVTENPEHPRPPRVVNEEVDNFALLGVVVAFLSFV